MTEEERKEIKAFSKRMYAGFHPPITDRIRAVRCHTLHENCRRLLNGDESVELLRMFKANADDLVKYDTGAYGRYV